MDKGTFDPNRDFPYFSDKTKDTSCMMTNTARTVNELYRVFMFVLAITFHRGDNVIGYPWGNFAHSSHVQDLKKPLIFIQLEVNLFL